MMSGRLDRRSSCKTTPPPPPHILLPHTETLLSPSDIPPDMTLLTSPSSHLHRLLFCPWSVCGPHGTANRASSHTKLCHSLPHVCTVPNVYHQRLFFDFFLFCSSFAKKKQNPKQQVSISNPSPLYKPVCQEVQTDKHRVKTYTQTDRQTYAYECAIKDGEFFLLDFTGH